jgi:hypothetical protein
MRVWRNRLAALAVALCAPAAAGGAPPASLGIEDARLAARQAVATRHWDLAADIARALLQRDPADPDALIVLASTEAARGNPAAALARARAAFAAAATPNQHYEAAMLAARANYQRKHYGAAQYWLRRASIHAADERLKALAVRNFRDVRAVNPLSTKLRFGISPSSNINNGSSAQVLFINGLPFILSGDAQALAGTEIEFGAAIERRFVLSPRRQVRLGANMVQRSYRLTREAQAAAGGKTGADYAFAAAEVSVGLDMLPADRDGARGRSDLGLTLGRNWYGGDALSNYAKLSWGQDWRLAPRSGLRLSGSLERQWRLDQARRSATNSVIAARFSHRLDSGNEVALAFGLRDTISSSAEIAHRGASVDLSYALGRPVAGAQMSFALGLEARDYKRVYLAGVRREDERASASLSMFFPKLEYMGFAPNVDLRITRTFSNVPLYESTEKGVFVGIRSAF